MDTPQKQPEHELITVGLKSRMRLPAIERSHPEIDDSVLERSSNPYLGRAPSFVVLIVLMFFGAGGYWSATAPLSKSVTAPGAIATDGQHRAIQTTNTGILTRIFVSEGDEVTSDQPLAQVDDLSLRTEREIARVTLQQLTAKEARLAAERDDVTDISFDHPILQSADAQEIRQEEQERLKFRKDRLDADLAILSAQIQQSKSKIEATAERAKALKTQFEINEEREAVLTDLMDRGHSRIEPILEIRQTIAALQAAHAQARADRIELEERITALRLEIRGQKITFAEQVYEELSSTRVQRAEAEERLAFLKERIEETILRSPTNGRVMNLKHSDAGAVISSAEVLMEIVPVQSGHLVRARVPAGNVDSVRRGQDVKFHLSTATPIDNPEVYGSVVEISADAEFDDKLNDYVFNVVVELTPDMSQLTEWGIDLVPGMRGQVFINAGEHTMLDYLMSPVQKIAANAFNEQ